MTLYIFQTIPYWDRIPGGSQIGTKIRIEGHPGRRCRRFDINFVMGQQVDRFVDDNDIAFHYNPRFDHNNVVRNTRINGVWGREEIEPHRNPFLKGVKFTIEIAITEVCYKTEATITFNNHQTINYNHRLYFRNANLIHISGDVVIDRICYCSPFPEPQVVPGPEPLQTLEDEVRTPSPVGSDHTCDSFDMLDDEDKA